MQETLPGKDEEQEEEEEEAEADWQGNAYRLWQLAVIWLYLFFTEISKMGRSDYDSDDSHRKSKKKKSKR
jgi:hypothetical protein